MFGNTHQLPDNSHKSVNNPQIENRESADILQELNRTQNHLAEYLKRGDFDNAVLNWEYIQQHIEDLTPKLLNKHIELTHQLVGYYLKDGSKDAVAKAQRLYHILQTSCFTLDVFLDSDRCRFYYSVGNNYTAHNHWYEALNYYTQALWLAKKSDVLAIIADLEKNWTF